MKPISAQFQVHPDWRWGRAGETSHGPLRKEVCSAMLPLYYFILYIYTIDDIKGESASVWVPGSVSLEIFKGGDGMNFTVNFPITRRLSIQVRQSIWFIIIFAAFNVCVWERDRGMGVKRLEVVFGTTFQVGDLEKWVGWSMQFARLADSQPVMVTVQFRSDPLWAWWKKKSVAIYSMLRDDVPTVIVIIVIGYVAWKINLHRHQFNMGSLFRLNFERFKGGLREWRLRCL